MTYRTFDVFADMDRLRRELDEFLTGGRSLWNLPFSRFSFLPGRASRSYPLLNVVDHADRLTIDALAPGLEPDSIDVSVMGNQVSISGQKKPHELENDDDAICHRTERAGGQFRRTLTLPSDIDRDGVRADYRDGLLRIELPKAETARPRRIQVSVG